MNIIFCDIDGVLNNHRTLRRKPPLDPDCVAILSTVAELTNARVVISSTWRYLHEWDELVAMFASVGFHDVSRIIDKTPLLQDFKDDICISQPRGIEIQAWLSAHPEVKRFVILDDDSDMEHLKPWLVKTRIEHGLTLDHLPRIHAALALGMPRDAGRSSKAPASTRD